MLFPLNLPSKDVLANRLVNYPTINAVLCLVLYEPKFRWALLLLLTIATALPLTVARIWPATPKGFTPRIKVSVLDLFQAAALKRTAVRSAALPDFKTALLSWSQAVANNPGDARLLRGLLDHVVSGEGLQAHAGLIGSHTRWLLRLTRTNEHDLALTLVLYEKAGLDDLTLGLLAPYQLDVPERFRPACAKALFRKGRIPDFAQRWEQWNLATAAGAASDHELKLYHAAFEAGWGDGAKSFQGRETIEQNTLDPRWSRLAQRLKSQVCAERLDAPGYRAALTVLQQEHLDTLSDHTQYWRLLTSLGRRAEALFLADQHTAPPTSPAEAVLLAQVYHELGLPDRAIQFLERFTPVYSWSDSIWITYGNLLTEQKDWPALRRLAFLLRHENNPLRDILGGYSFYLEGLSNLKEGREPEARRAFARIPTQLMDHKLLAFVIAGRLDALNYPEPAVAILLRLRQELPANPEYWVLLAKAAFGLKDPDLLCSALSSALKLRPNDRFLQNNFAAALLSTRRRPDEAIQWTWTVLQHSPDSPAAQLNHCLALIQNHRLGEAGAMLSGVAFGNLDPGNRTTYHVAQLELMLANRELRTAGEVIDKIDLAYLQPPELAWLQQQKRLLQSQSAPSARPL
jgi:hypothetical protein